MLNTVALAQLLLRIASMAKKDFTQTAFDVFQQAIGEKEKPAPLSDKQVNSSRGGKIGGVKRAENLSKDELTRQAKKAADARWKK